MCYHPIRRLGAIAFLLFLIPGTASADISYARDITVSASGPLNSFSSKSTVLTQISGDRARSEIQAESIFPGEMNSESISILRLDQGLSWQLDPMDKAYREVSMESLRQVIGDFKDQVQAAAGGQALPFNPETCEWSEAQVSARSSKEKERIAGLRATRHFMTVYQTCKDATTNRTCNVEWSLEPWLSTKVPDGGEVSNFYSELADQLYMNPLIPQMAGPSQMLLAMFPNRWETLLDELENFEGYPLRNVMSMKISGPLCLNAQGVPLDEDDSLLENTTDSAYNAAVYQSGRQAGAAAGGAAAGALGDGVGGAIGSSAVGAATGELIGGLTGMFSKKKKPKTVQPAAPTDLTLFKVTSEVTSWSDITIPPDRFELPTGWSPVD
jgi:hypothetical protein